MDVNDIKLREEDCTYEILPKCCFVEVDIYIPEDLKFVPISYKDGEGLANFRTGNIRKIVINHVDIEELERFDIKITKFY